jgi:olfactory receptor
MTGLIKRSKVMNYSACATQIFLFVTFANVENYLLASMTYDRYAAVCKPLHYTTMMTTSVCVCVIMGCCHVVS